MGALTANMMFEQGNEVTVIDKNEESFNRLSKKFTGKKIVGNGLEISTLERAGLATTDAFVATTNYDTRNILAATIAKNNFSVTKVIARFYDGERAKVFSNLGIETICVTNLGSEKVCDLISGKAND